MDTLETVISVVVLVVMFIGGCLFGSSAYDNGWRKDCEELGMHRADKDVYICRKR